ncbi:MAG: methylenetetrahydrofolate--tRNA-(uracil(54)-C(5))-methyltransferase (FADH(2)-oxidizing) TrmFO [Bdellovibrionaceae bacterium]|nr:methylenetetrahydrofolate--tRNA-(uracil(54)-C(5))-methyltransferase (FADH(2)-oxidizing) TrmFO [Pseudobdellovibrionaceae bacterium]
MKTVSIVGAGLAGSECAFQLAQKGYKVTLYEMRDQQMTPAHQTKYFAELVCSNSFGSQTTYSAPGQLKWEAEKLNSLLLKIAKKHQVPAGMALAVDRQKFANEITNQLNKHPNITIVQKTISSLQELKRPAVIASGPLTNKHLATALSQHFNTDSLYFFDAIAPIVDAESINWDKVWLANRFDDIEKDYINCPLNKEEYFNLIEEIKKADTLAFKNFEKEDLKLIENTPYFDACMPIEVIISRGDLSLRFGPLSPKGLTNPHSKEKPFAVVQLRTENKDKTAYNMVGFQTKMNYPEQKRIFKMIPGLENADFLKLGSIHRNLYINSPKKLNTNLSSKADTQLFFAGQITGVEGYFESTCMGLLAALSIDQGNSFTTPPPQSAFGALLNAITEDKDHFQPTNINFSLFKPLTEKDIARLQGNLLSTEQKLKGRKNKQARRDLQIKNAQYYFNQWAKNL